MAKDEFDNEHYKAELKARDGVANDDIGDGIITDNADQLKRKLNNRQIQLLAIGGSIGTALFVSIGGALATGGPGSLFIAYTLYSCVLALVNNCIAEMTILHPSSGGFIRLAGKWVDDSFGFMAGWNLFLYEALLIPFEITAVNSVLAYWRSDIPVAAVCAVVIVLYSAINLIAVKGYGEAEFWLSGGKVLLIFMLFSFTLVSMCGGNPQHDAYGFRNWGNPPGAFAEYRSTGDKGRFEGFLACLFSAAFTVVGPEYISMAAAETKRPRKFIKTAFKTVYWRFGVFFILGALCVGIVVPWTDPRLGSGSTAAASPYVIAMNNLRINGLPDLVNALLITSIFSAGNTYTYVATRTLYGLALEGRAPKFFKKCTRAGVPWAAFLLTIAFAFLSFLSVSNSSKRVLNILISLITAGGLINYIVMTTTYIFFHRACKVQNVDRRTFPYYARFQPYSAYIALVVEVLLVLFYGYEAFSDITAEKFFTNYTMQIIVVLLYVFWKLYKRTPFVKPAEADLIWERPIVDAYEASFLTPPVGFWRECLQMVGIGRTKAQRAGHIE